MKYLCERCDKLIQPPYITTIELESEYKGSSSDFVLCEECTKKLHKFLYENEK